MLVLPLVSMSLVFERRGGRFLPLPGLRRAAEALGRRGLMSQHSSSAQCGFQEMTYVLRPAVDSVGDASDSCDDTCGERAYVDNECQLGALKKLMADNNVTLAYIALEVSD